MKYRVTKIITCLIISLCIVILSYEGYKFFTDEDYSLADINSNKPILRVKTINFWGKGKGAEVAPIWEILQEKYRVKIVKLDYDVLLVGPTGKKSIPASRDDVIKIYLTAEVHVGDTNEMLLDTDLVLGFDYIDHNSYMRFPYYYTHFLNNIDHNKLQRTKECSPREKKHFACFLVSNYGFEGSDFKGAELRKDLFHRLNEYKTVVSGGKFLNNIGRVVPRSETMQWLSQCKFTIAYENNISYPGYITEKPFQAWMAETIPLYHSSADAVNDLNKDSVLYARDYDSVDSFIDYIIKVDNDDELYCKIWKRGILPSSDNNYAVIKEKLRVRINNLLKQKLPHLISSD